MPAKADSSLVSLHPAVNALGRFLIWPIVLRLAEEICPMTDDRTVPPFVYEGLDPVSEPKSAIAQALDAVTEAVHRVGDAIDKGRKPGMPLSILSSVAREAPLGSLLVAFLAGVAVGRRSRQKSSLRGAMIPCPSAAFGAERIGERSAYLSYREARADAGAFILLDCIYLGCHRAFSRVCGSRTKVRSPPDS